MMFRPIHTWALLGAAMLAAILPPANAQRPRTPPAPADQPSATATADASDPAAAIAPDLPIGEPTDLETHMLELLNRFRADPLAETDRINAIWEQLPRYFTAGVDREMFLAEMRELKPAQPLVFNPLIINAARGHSRYMILNEMTHTQEVGRPGFTGVTPSDRMAAAGYRSGGAAENCFKSAPDVLGSHIGFIIDFGPGGEGGMQAGRGHRMNMINPGYREVGLAAVPHSGGLSVTHNFASGSGRYVGGVAYVDRNRNGMYDPGEGRGGVEFTASDGTSTTTWSSGAYSLPLKGRGKVTVTARLGDLTITREIPAGAENVKFDFQILTEQELAAIDQLIKRVRSARADSPEQRRAALTLYRATRGMQLEEDRLALIAELCGDIGPTFERLRKEAIEALDKGDADALKPVTREATRLFRGSDLMGWFNEAEEIVKIAKAVASLEERDRTARARDLATTQKMQRELIRRKSEFKEADMQSRLNGLLARVTRLTRPR